MDRLLQESAGYVQDKLNTHYTTHLYDLKLLKIPCETSILDGVYWVKPQSKNYEKEEWFQSLLVKPMVNGKPGESFSLVFQHPLGFLGVPKFYGLSLFGAPTKDTRRKHSHIQIEFKKDRKLREYQEKCVQQTLEKLEEWGGATIIADCGAGKTAMSLNLVTQLKVKTLIICNRLFLMEQWKTEIQAWTHTQPETIGWLQGSTAELTKEEKNEFGKDIVIASIESLSRCYQSKDIMESFHFVIIDEMHHLAAKTLSQVLPKLPARYILGVTATPQRSDGLEHVLYWLVGPTSFVYKRIPEITGKASNVFIRTLPFKSENAFVEGGYMKMVQMLIKNEKRNDFIISIINDLRKERKKILITTSSVEHGQALLEQCLKFEPLSVFIHGGSKQVLVDKAKGDAKLVFATYQYMEEGYDDPTLDTLILALPRSKIQQVIGRCERYHEGKLDPLIVDIIDNHFFFKGMFRKRQKFYKEREFNHL